MLIVFSKIVNVESNRDEGYYIITAVPQAATI